MNIAEVKKAQEIIREAKRELEKIVKEYLETAEVIEDADILHEDFCIDFKHDDDGLHISVFFNWDNETDCYDYSISCPEYEISYYQPPRKNDCTAQGTVDVVWDEEKKDGKMVPVIKTIRLQKYRG